MKKLLLAGFVALGTWGLTLVPSQVTADPVNCALVLCPVCPEGQVLSPTPGNCCRCVKA